MKTFNFALIATTALSLGACAGKPPEAPQPPDKVVATAAVKTLDELDMAIENGIQLQNEKGEQIVCRKEAKTGSRLARETVCMTRADWLRVSEESQRATKRSMRGGSIPQGSD